MVYDQIVSLILVLGYITFSLSSFARLDSVYKNSLPPLGNKFRFGELSEIENRSKNFATIIGTCVPFGDTIIEGLCAGDGTLIIGTRCSEALQYKIT